MNKYRIKFGKRFIYAMLVILLLTACGSLAPILMPIRGRQPRWRPER